MALSPRISTAAAKAATDAVTALLSVGGAGYIEVRTGSQPATVATAASGTLLGTLPLSATAFGAATTASPSVATANAITSDTTADASGTAGWFRAYNNAGTGVIDGSVGTSGCDLNLDNITIVAGGVIAVSSWTVSHPTT